VVTGGSVLLPTAALGGDASSACVAGLSAPGSIAIGADASAGRFFLKKLNMLTVTRGANRSAVDPARRARKAGRSARKHSSALRGMQA